jgi:hypothetical protein
MRRTLTPTTNPFSGSVFNRESFEAYLQQTKSLENRVVPVLGLFYDNPLGLTQDETAVRLGMLTQTAAPIITDLLKRGLLIRKPIPGSNDYETRATRSKYNAAVCVLSPDWGKAAAEYRERKKMERESEKAEKLAVHENVVLRGLVGDLVAIIEESVPFKDAELTEALALIRKEYL